MRVPPVCGECEKPIAYGWGSREYHIECRRKRSRRFEAERKRAAMAEAAARETAMIEAQLALEAKRAKLARRMAA